MSKQFNKSIREWAGIFMHRSMSDFKRFMQEAGISYSQVNILVRLFHRGNVGVSEIGEKMGVTSAAASQVIDQMVQAGLVSRTEVLADRRIKRLELTQKGKTLIEKGFETRSKWLENIGETLTPYEQEIIITAFSILTNASRKIEE